MLESVASRVPLVVSEVCVVLAVLSSAKVGFVDPEVRFVPDGFFVPLGLTVAVESISVADGDSDVFEPLDFPVAVGFLVLLVAALVGEGSSVFVCFDDGALVGSGFVELGTLVDLGGLVDAGFLLVFVLLALAVDFGFFVFDAGGLGSATSPVFAFSGPNARHLEKRSHSFDWYRG